MKYEEILKELTNEPMEEYHSRSKENLSSHRFAGFRDQSPAYFKADQDGLIPEFDNAAFATGTACHTLILEGQDAYDDEYEIGGPINEKTDKPFGRETKKFRDYCIANEIKPEKILSFDDHDLCRAMKKSCDGNELVKDILSQGVAEKVIRANYNGIDCQIRMDWFREEGMYDLKTCQDLNWFAFDARKKYNYLANAAFYRSVFYAAFPNAPEIDYSFIAVEKKVPYRAAVFTVDPGYLDTFEAKNDAAMERLIECRKTNVWPSNFEGLNVIEAWKKEE